MRGVRVHSPYARSPCDCAAARVQVGKGKVIRGWDEGVATMKVGEVRDWPASCLAFARTL